MPRPPASAPSSPISLQSWTKVRRVFAGAGSSTLSSTSDHRPTAAHARPNSSRAAAAVSDDCAYLDDIEEAIHDIREFTRDGEAAFLSDQKTQFAVVRNRRRIGPRDCSDGVHFIRKPPFYVLITYIVSRCINRASARFAMGVRCTIRARAVRFRVLAA